jgi:hypothetical protein
MQTPPPAPPQAPIVPPAQGLADLASLNGQLGELNVQLAGLKAQWDGLKYQLDHMLSNNPARPGVQQQWSNVGVQIADVEGKIASLNARIAQRQGRPVGTPNMPVAPRLPTFNGPNMVVAGVTAVSLVLAVPISIAWARRIWRGSSNTPVASTSHDVTARLERIEHAIDTVAIEVERISEGQRFVTKIMAERPTSAASNNGAPADSKQPLALGAGPIEPVVVQDRDAVGAKLR